MEELASESTERTPFMLPESPADQGITNTSEENWESQKHSKISNEKQTEDTAQMTGSSESKMIEVAMREVSKKQTSNTKNEKVKIGGVQLKTRQLTAEKSRMKRKHESGEKTESDCVEITEGETENIESSPETKRSTSMKNRTKRETGQEWNELQEEEVKYGGKKARIFWLDEGNTGEEDEIVTESDTNWSESTEEEEESIGKMPTAKPLILTRRKNIEVKKKSKNEQLKNMEIEQSNKEKLSILKKKLETRRKVLTSPRMNTRNSGLNAEGGKMEESQFLEDLLTLLMPEGETVKKKRGKLNTKVNKQNIPKQEMSKSRKNTPDLKKQGWINVESVTESSDNDVVDVDDRYDIVRDDIESETESYKKSLGHTELSKDGEIEKLQHDMVVGIVEDSDNNDADTNVAVKKEIDCDIEIVEESFDYEVPVLDDDANNRLNESDGESSVDLIRERKGGAKNLKSDTKISNARSDDSKLCKIGEKKNKSKGSEVYSEKVVAQKISSDGKITNSANNRKKRIQCTFCDKTFTKRSNLNNHMPIHTGIKPHVCHLCQKAFARKASLELHIKTHLNVKIKKYECQLCQERFSSKGSLAAHLNIHKKKYECSACHTVFALKSQLISHSTIHPEINNFVCSECGKSFTKKYLLRIHATSHSDVRDYICEFCGKTYKSKRCLKQHRCGNRDANCGKKGSSDDKHPKKERDKIKKKYKCNFCEKIYSTSNGLAVHKALHTGQKKHVCHLCGKAYVIKKHLDQHLLVHSGIKNHECHFCHKRFIRKDHLTKHLYLHTGKKHECPICDKRFTTNVEVVIHSSVHTGIKRYECSECYKSFNTNSQLVHHRSVHDGLDNHNQNNPELRKCNRKNYPCLDCGKPFATKAERVQHESTHLNIRNFGCDICGKKYKSKISLVNHRCKNKDVVESNLDTHFGGESNLKTQLLGLPGDQSLTVVDSGETKESLVPPGSQTVPYDPPKKIFQCDQCAMNFPTKFQLNKHMKKHSGLKDYKCETCGKCFTQLDNLNRHRRVIHLGGSRLVGKHVCKYCQKVFKMKEELAYHWKNIHGVVEDSLAANGEELFTLTTL